MSAESVIYYLNRMPAQDPAEDEEWLFAALGQYSGAELRELLYTAQEPDFFDLMRGLFAMPEHSRAALLEFLTQADARPVQATIEPDGRCTLQRAAAAVDGKPPLKLVE
jgi:hypothetical protein